MLFRRLLTFAVHFCCALCCALCCAECFVIRSLCNSRLPLQLMVLSPLYEVVPAGADAQHVHQRERNITVEGDVCGPQEDKWGHWASLLASSWKDTSKNSPKPPPTPLAYNLQAPITVQDPVGASDGLGGAPPRLRASSARSRCVDDALTVVFLHETGEATRSRRP